MAIIKGQIHPENNLTDLIYPETSVDQVKDLAIYKHTVEVIGVPNSNNEYLVITYDIYSYDNTLLTKENVREDIYYNGVCIVYNDLSSAEKILGMCGKFKYYRSDNPAYGLAVDIFRDQDEVEFRVNTITDTVTNIFTESIIEEKP